MNSGEFHRHLGRLTEQFGKAAYSQPRAELIWREVKELSDAWWRKTVDHLLLICRQAPLMPEFYEEIAKERERLYKIKKEEHTTEAKDYWDGTYQPDDVKTICQYIKKRMQGEVSDPDYQTFLRHLKVAVKDKTSACTTCSNSGIVLVKTETGFEYVYRCFCSTGRINSSPYPMYQPENHRAAGEST